MGNLRDFSTDELQRELERRRRIISDPPAVRAKPSFQTLTNIAIAGVADIVKNGYEDDDFKQYVYEAAMEAIYGEDFWAWRNNLKF